MANTTRTWTSPKQILGTFKMILDEAARTYGVAPSQITKYQFLFVSSGRMSEPTFAGIASYATLRGYFYPMKDKKLAGEQIAAIRRLINAKHAA